MDDTQDRLLEQNEHLAGVKYGRSACVKLALKDLPDKSAGYSRSVDIIGGAE
jgi:hypothetical protein